MKLIAALTGLSLVLLAGAAPAQAVYRTVDRSGKVVFTDQPPTANASSAPAPGDSSSASDQPLPYELRQVVQRYPVILYTGADCGGCSAGRSLLITRGVPFEERTVKSNEDIAALQRLSGQTGLPVLAIGSQKITGFSDSEWSQYLDAAAYPASTQLPAGFRNPDPRPLVAVQQATPAAAPTATAAPVPAAASDATAPPSGPTPSNPAGIKF